MSKPKIAILTESPDDCKRTWDTITYIMEPLEKDFEVKRLSVLDGEPKNGKAATKTEINHSRLGVIAQLQGFDYVVLVGNTPLQVVTGKAGISKLRGKPLNVDGHDRLYLPMNNPGIIRHDDKQEILLQADMKFLRDMISFGGIPEEEELDWRIVTSWDDFDDMMAELYGTVSFDIETTQLYPWRTQHQDKDGKWVKDPEPKIVSFGFGTKETQWCIPVHHPQSPWSEEEILDMIEEITERMEDLTLVAHNGKFDLLWVWVHFGVRWMLGFDTMLAHFLLDENSRHGLKYLAQVFCGAPDWEIDLTEKQGMNVPLKKHCKYLAHDLFYTRKLRYVFGKMFKKDPEVRRVFDLIMMPCANLFVEIEYDGVYIDRSQFKDAEEALREQYDSALAELKEWEPDYVLDAKGKQQPFNWGSSVQLAKLLFEDLGIKPLDKTAAGNPSCSESVIKRLDHPCTDALLKFRAAKQQLSFFIDGWKPFLHKRPGGWYLHPSFKLHGTVTGRLSCEHPNLQQVPRDPRIRSLISAEEGWTLIQCDLSQAELRIAAELARERSMIHAFINGIDVHWLTAVSEIGRGGGLKELVIGTAWTYLQDYKKTGQNQEPTYSESIELLLEMGHDTAIQINGDWKEFRKKAKAINFGYLYGMWWKKFKIYARDNYGVVITDGEAEESREAFFDNYSDLPSWHKRQARYARRHGYVKTLSGRKRRLPEAMGSENTPERKAAERQAINSPVQSFANEINLMAALQLRKEFGRKVVRICGTVHDAVLFRVRNDRVVEVYHRMLEIMSWPELMDDFGIVMTVPIAADGDVGPWGKGASLEAYKVVADHDKCTIEHLLNTMTSSEIKDRVKEITL